MVKVLKIWPHLPKASGNSDRSELMQLSCLNALGQSKQTNKDETNSSATVRRMGTWSLFSTLRIESTVDSWHFWFRSQVKLKMMGRHEVSNSKLPFWLQGSASMTYRDGQVEGCYRFKVSEGDWTWNRAFQYLDFTDDFTGEFVEG